MTNHTFSNIDIFLFWYIPTLFQSYNLKGWEFEHVVIMVLEMSFFPL